LLSVTELRGSNLSISVHDLKYIDATNASATNPDTGDYSKKFIIKDEDNGGK
jgi:hypothetical protein